MTPGENGLYTVALTVYSEEHKPLADARVVLSSVAKKQEQQAVTNAARTVRFSQLAADIYDATVQVEKKKVGESIINVTGDNHLLTLGIDLEAQKNNALLRKSGSVLGIATSSPYVLAGMIGAGVILGTGVALLIVRLKSRKSTATAGQ